MRQLDLSPNVTLEIDSLAILMETVSAGLIATVQPGAALARLRHKSLKMAELSDPGLARRNLLVSLSDEEMSPAALAARVVMRQVALQQVREGKWLGAALAPAPEKDQVPPNTDRR